MAFKVLNDRELLALNDAQRAYYEADLALYQERVAFVEWNQSHKLMQPMPAEPKIAPIAVIGRIEQKAFVKPDYERVVCEPVKKPIAPELPFAKPAVTSPVLPKPPRRPILKLEQRPIKTRAKPVLPVCNRPQAPEIRLGKFEMRSPELPKVAKPVAAFKEYQPPQKEPLALPVVPKATRPLTGLVKPANKDTKSIVANLPKPPKPHITRNAFVPPKKQKPELPKVSIKQATIKPYCKPERSYRELPIVAKASPSIPLLKGLRQTSQDSAAPGLSAPNPATGEGLPHATRSETPAQRVAPVLPAVLLPKAKQKPYLPPSLESPRLVCVEVPQFKAKPFLGFKAKVAALPRVPPLVVPDAYEKLKDLLPQAKGSKPVEASDQKDAASRNAKP